MMEFVAFNLILDDIINPPNPRLPDILGGGGPQAAFGMRLWTENVGLVSGIGLDFPEAHRKCLERLGIDLSGLRIGPYPTLQAEQIYQSAAIISDGTNRVHRWLSPPEAINSYLIDEWLDLPAHFRRAKGYHLGIHPDAEDWHLLKELKRRGAVISAELFRPANAILEKEQIHKLLHQLTIFSATREETVSIIGPASDEALVSALADGGAQIICLRLGMEGSLVYNAMNGEGYRLPAYRTLMADVTGAGNAYGGGFLAAWADGAELMDAALKGTVAASLVIEQPGLPCGEINTLRQEARKRYTTLKKSAKIEAFRL